MRECYIDMVKGLSILCITFLHYEKGVLPNSINIFVGSFMITAFYVTSGWVSAMNNSQRPLKELIKKRWKQLGVPYTWWTIIILSFDLILYAWGYYDLKFIGREIYKTITLRGIGTLWFLPALFGGEIIWHWLKNQNKTWLIIVALAVTIFYNYYYGLLLGEKEDTIYRIIDAPFRTISNMLNAWIGVAFGYYSWQLFKNKILNANNAVLATSGIILCTLAFISANYLPKFLYPCWNFFAPLLGPFGFLLLFKSLQKLKVFEFFEYWGRNSLNLMVTHYSIILVLFTIMVENLLKKPFNGWITIICFIASLPIQYLLVKFINNYCKFTLGK